MPRAVAHADWAVCRSAEAQGFKSVSHALVLSNLADAARAAIAAGTLLVPGGYPEAWAREMCAPFPPLRVARAAPPAERAASGDGSSSGASEATNACNDAAAPCVTEPHVSSAGVPVCGEAAALGTAQPQVAEAAPRVEAARPALSARRPKRGSLAELQRVANRFAPTAPRSGGSGGRAARGSAAISSGAGRQAPGAAAEPVVGRKRTRSMRLSDAGVQPDAAGGTHDADDAVVLNFPSTAGKAAPESAAAPRWQVRKFRRIVIVPP